MQYSPYALFDFKSSVKESVSVRQSQRVVNWWHWIMPKFKVHWANAHIYSVFWFSVFVMRSMQPLDNWYFCIIRGLNSDESHDRYIYLWFCHAATVIMYYWSKFFLSLFSDQVPMKFLSLAKIYLSALKLWCGPHCICTYLCVSYYTMY